MIVNRELQREQRVQKVGSTAAPNVGERRVRATEKFQDVTLEAVIAS